MRECPSANSVAVRLGPAAVSQAKANCSRAAVFSNSSRNWCRSRAKRYQKRRSGLDRNHPGNAPIWPGSAVRVMAVFESDSPRGAGGLMSWAASKAVGPRV